MSEALQMATTAASIEPAPGTERYPRRIGRRVTLFLAILILGGLAVGGTSVTLGFAIVRNHDAVVREYEHVARLDAVHAAFHDLVFELHQVDSTRGPERVLEAKVVQDELFRALERLASMHVGDELLETRATEEAVAAELYGLAERARDLTERLRGGGHMAAADLDWLHRTTHLVPRRVEELARLHRTRISELVGQSRSQIRTITALFVVFLGLGTALVAFMSMSLNRDVAQPLRSLAAAVRAIAEGRLDARVPVASRDEIGQLASDFNRMAERLQANERSLDEAQRNLQQTAREAATLQERERLAREMHDGFAQSLALLTLKLQSLSDAEKTPRLAAALQELLAITQQAYQDVRQSIFGLRTFVSRGLGLEAALSEYLHEWSVQNGIAVDLEVKDGALAQVPAAAEVQLVRIIQEALVNVRKHAGTTRARVRVGVDGGHVLVTIEDEGCGWSQAEAASGRLHFGLHTMRERAEGIGGRLEVTSQPGRGTQVVASIPRARASV